MYHYIVIYGYSDTREERKMENRIEEYRRLADILKVLAHPVRLCIVNGLLRNGGCNVSHMQDCLRAPQSTISQHLQKLRAAGIIAGERRGTEVVYRVVDERVKAMLELWQNEEG